MRLVRFVAFGLALGLILVAFPYTQTDIFERNLIPDTKHNNILADYVVHDPILITSDADFEIQGWPGNGSIIDPYVIEGVSVDGMDIENCILIANTTAHFIIRNCLLYNGGSPLWMFYEAGLTLHNSTNGLVEHNIIIGGDHQAIVLQAQADNNTIAFNNCSNSRYGILMHGSSNNLISSNLFIAQQGSISKGIHLSGYSYDGGLTATYCSKNLILNNSFADYDINAEEICIYQRENSHENCTHSQWDDGVSIGNVWDDYNGTGVYPISGIAGTFDHYPRQSYSHPVVDHPDDIEYEESITGYSITWKPNDIDPLNYTIYLDGGAYKSGLWNSSSEEITVSVDGLPYGTHNFTIVVMDVELNPAIDTVMVSVVDTAIPSLSSPEDIQFEVGATGYSLTWTLQDANPFSYEVFMNSTLIKSGIWNSTGDTVTITLDSLTVGIHIITITITDLAGNEASDTVIVSVLPESTTTTGTTETTTTGPPADTEFPFLLVIGIGIGCGAIIIVIVIIIMKRR
ncbi:MAG: NosD domain-containing protein [Candidatus Thorarchaeota archaeon]